MSFRYTAAQRKFKILKRKFFPVPKSPWTGGHVDDICAVNLVPPADLKSFFQSCIKRLQDIKGKEIGDYLEFGVFNGSSISSMFLTCKKLCLNNVKFFGFDAFQGLPKGAELEDDGVWKKGFYHCPFQDMTKCLEQKDIDPSDIQWIKGWYKDTLNDETLKKFGIGKIGIIFIDCDTYSSSKTVLNFLGPLLTEPAIICLDDWKLNDLDIKGMGEYKSFNEFLDGNPQFTAEEIKSYNRKSKSFLIRPAS